MRGAGAGRGCPPSGAQSPSAAGPQSPGREPALPAPVPVAAAPGAASHGHGGTLFIPTPPLTWAGNAPLAAAGAAGLALRRPTPSPLGAEAVTSSPPGRSPGLESDIPSKAPPFGSGQSFLSGPRKRASGCRFGHRIQKDAGEDFKRKKKQLLFGVKAELCALCLIGSPRTQLEGNRDIWGL